jgi:hypothetical protein
VGDEGCSRRDDRLELRVGVVDVDDSMMDAASLTGVS